MNPMTKRLPAILAAAAMTLAAWTPDARALHPAPFPHQHAQEAAPRPPEARPRREPVGAHAKGALSVGIGFTGGVIPATGSSISNSLDSGVGFNLHVGWRLNDWASVDLEWFTTFHDASFPKLEVDEEPEPDPAPDPTNAPEEADPARDIDSAMMSSLSGLVRIYFLDPGFFEPYLAAGVGIFMLSEGLNSEDTLTGLGFCAGLGAAFNLSETFGVGARVLYRGAFFDNREVPTPLPAIPAETSFVNLVTLSAHVRVNF